MNRFITQRTIAIVRHLLLILIVLTSLTAARPSQAADIPKIDILAERHPGTLVDDIALGFTVNWDPPGEPVIYANWFVYLDVIYYDDQGNAIPLQDPQGNPIPYLDLQVGTGDTIYMPGPYDTPGSISGISIATEHAPPGTRSFVYWYKLRVVIANGIDLLADRSKVTKTFAVP